jgi:hypothetical protein
MRSTVLIFGFVLGTQWCVGQANQPAIVSGAITGTVKGAHGAMILSGTVTASRVPDSAKLNGARALGTATIAQDGSFRLPALAQGTYRICIQIPNSTWIDPCEWEPVASPAALLSGTQPSAPVNVVLKKGVLVTVRVSDPTGLLSLRQSPGLLIGVRNDFSGFRRAALISQSSGDRTYQVLIPFDRSINISVTSPSIRLNDATGKLFTQASNPISVRVSSGQPAPTVTLTVADITHPLP